MTRRRVDAKGELTEAAWQGQVTGLANFYGWRWYHTSDSRKSPPGFPDLTLVRGPELLFAELKTTTGRVRPGQAEWLADLGVVATAVEETVRYMDTDAVPLDFAEPAVEVYLWRPPDWDAIHERLARGRHRQEPIG